MIFLNQFTFSEFHESSTHHDVKPTTSSALNKIERSVDTKLQQKKSELADIQKVYENLLAPVTKPEPCGIRVLRCSNCLRIGHKAEGNSGKKNLAQMINVQTTSNVDKSAFITTFGRRRDRR